jgi:hypothetical protein
MSVIALTSRIHRVVVHARGAVVTRAVTLPSPLPSDTCELVVPDITPLAEPASFRAIAKGSRQVVSVVARFVVPEGPAKLGSASERVQAAEAARVALSEERAHVMGRRNQLAGVQFDLGLDKRFQKANARTRIGDALAMTKLVHDELAGLDERLAKLDRNIAEAERILDAARIAEHQARTAERAGASRPTLACHVRLGPGQTPPETLEIEYTVLAARFWPTYKAWLTKGATRVRLELDALVVQDTGEDWTNVEMSLSTADLVHDARLPELSSLRFGRATPKQKRGYRAPPLGLDSMFEAYDAAMLASLATRTRDNVDMLHSLSATRGVAPRPGAAAPPPPQGFGPPDDVLYSLAAMPMLMHADDEGGAELDRSVPEQAKSKKGSSSRTRAGAIPPPARMAPPMPKSAGPLGGFGGGGIPSAASYGMLAEEAEESLGDVSSVGPVEPDDAWLDFDALKVPGGDEPRRGKLTRLPDDHSRSEAIRAKQKIESMTSPARTKDPYVYRGLFDYCYEAVGRGDIPSNGRPHRVHVLAGEGPAKPRFRTAPRESTDVFREALIENPMGAPLCAGPMDVFLDGALVTTTESAAVDRGGVFVVGLGVEERIRIARNARIEESSAGLLGGSTHVDHHVTVDITSSLGMSVNIEVLERIPITDDKDISIKVTSADPEPEVYDQSDLGSPIRGGRRFRVDVAAGGKAKVAYGYRIKLPAKSEIVGGNRRE